MALTSNDETDLLLPLYRGLEETPRFATFLDRLRRRTGAQLADVVLEGDFDGSPGLGLLPADQGARRAIRPFRTYTLAELSPVENGFTDARLAMFPLPDAMRGWLVLARNRPCSAADSALISSLVPYVQTVTAVRVEAQRERAAAALSGGGLSRTGTGWILLDAELRLLDIEPHTRRDLSVLTGRPPATGERLRGIPASAERCFSLAAENDAGPRFAVLSHEPRIDAVIERIEPGSELARTYADASLIAWCRFERRDGSRRADALAGLYDLPPREAEFAVAMADGLSIAQAGRQMGLTIETARNYSKQLYAKLDISGQAQLVRLVQRSGAALA